MTSDFTHTQNVYGVATGTTNTDPFVTVLSPVNPTSNNTGYQVQKRWVNTTTLEEWILLGYTSNTGVVLANWQPITNSSSIPETLTANTGGAVGPDGSNNINVLGDTTTIEISGNPATHTLVASTTGIIATHYTENSGTAVPSAGNLNVLGGSGISTSGSGSTITITSTGSVPLQFTENVGTAVPFTNNLNVLGALGIITSGSGSTVSIQTDGTVATSYVENSGTAIPSAGVLNVLGASGITTVGSGDTITIETTGAVATTYTENTGTATPALNNLNVVGGTGISTTGSGSTITINALGTVPITFTENSGTATPALNNLNILGGTGITTTGSGSTVTITATGVVSLTYTNVTHAMSPYTVLSTDEYISVDCSGGIVQLNFPNAPASFKTWIVKDRTGSAATSNITLTTPGGTVTFDGLTTYTMNSNYQAIQLIANATPTYEVY